MPQGLTWGISEAGQNITDEIFFIIFFFYLIHSPASHLPSQKASYRPLPVWLAAHLCQGDAVTEHRALAAAPLTLTAVGESHAFTVVHHLPWRICSLPNCACAKLICKLSKLDLWRVHLPKMPFFKKKKEVLFFFCFKYGIFKIWFPVHHRHLNYHPAQQRAERQCEQMRTGTPVDYESCCCNHPAGCRRPQHARHSGFWQQRGSVEVSRRSGLMGQEGECLNSIFSGDYIRQC